MNTMNMNIHFLRARARLWLDFPDAMEYEDSP
jgi:hypothetical protein